MHVRNPKIELILSSDYFFLKNKIDYVIKTFLEVYSISKTTRICLGTQQDDSIFVCSSSSIDFFKDNKGVPKKNRIYAMEE